MNQYSNARDLTGAQRAIGTGLAGTWICGRCCTKRGNTIGRMMRRVGTAKTWVCAECVAKIAERKAARAAA